MGGVGASGDGSIRHADGLRSRRLTLVIAVTTLLLLALVIGLWVNSQRVWLRDDYRAGFDVGEGLSRESRLAGCQAAAIDRFGEGASGDIKEEVAAFTVGCLDGATSRYRPNDVGGLVDEHLGG